MFNSCRSTSFISLMCWSLTHKVNFLQSHLGFWRWQFFGVFIFKPVIWWKSVVSLSYTYTLLRLHFALLYIEKENKITWWKKKKKLSKAVNLMLGCSFTLTETISLGLSLGDSGFGASAGNVSSRALRASRDMEPPWRQNRIYQTIKNKMSV